jgi:hypothetical protein
MSSTGKTPQYTAYGLPSCQSVSVTAAAVTAAVTAVVSVAAAVTAAAVAAAVTAAAVTAAAVTAAAVTAAAAGLDFIWVEDPEALARVRHRLTPGGWKRPSKKEGGPMDRPLVWRTADNSAVDDRSGSSREPANLIAELRQPARDIAGTRQRFAAW